MRRTLIALPHDRCVHVDVDQHEPPLAAARRRALLVGERFGQPSPQIFGGSAAPSTRRSRRRPGPTLAIDFSSAGGELVVRDYPDDVDPGHQPDWPGYPVFLEERPDTTGLDRAEAKRMVREWRDAAQGAGALQGAHRRADRTARARSEAVSDTRARARPRALADPAGRDDRASPGVLLVAGLALALGEAGATAALAAVGAGTVLALFVLVPRAVAAAIGRHPALLVGAALAALPVALIASSATSATAAPCTGSPTSSARCCRWRSSRSPRSAG